MLRYTIGRIISGVVTVYLMATITFFAMHSIPGDPLLTAKALHPEIRAQLMAHYGLDRPLYIQYGNFVKDVLRGDFGISFAQRNRPVNDIIKEHFPISALLGVLAITFAAIGGVTWGAFAAINRNRLSDRVLMFLVILFVSVPSFVFAAMAQFVLSEIYKYTGVEVLPVAGWGQVQHMILPALVLGLGAMAFLTRLMRSSMLEVVTQDYIRTAKAKGLSPLRIFWKHEFRNAVLPVVTYLGPTVAAITTGGFVAETVFAIPGLGRYFVQAVQQMDYTVIMGLTTFYGAYLVSIVIIVDIVYGFIDPRIKLAKGAA